MPDKTHHRRGFSHDRGRLAKARKILQILADSGHPITASTCVLDVGTGSGEIAAYISRQAIVTSVDVVDQRATKDGFPFVLTGRRLPFRNGAFDLVISNHVIEHTSDPALHLQEMHRVLRPGGLVYLATPNRWWPWEVHYRLPLLHYLPRPLFTRLLQYIHRFSEELQLLSSNRLRALCAGGFQLEFYSDRIIKDPSRYGLAVSRPVEVILKKLPTGLLRLLVPIHPTLVVLLTRNLEL